MRIAIRRIGNSKGMIIPTPLLAQIGLQDEAEVSVEDGAIVVRAPAQAARNGWAEASQALVAADDDGLVLPEFANAEDEDLAW
jgi:antitoxin MazE